MNDNEQVLRGISDEELNLRCQKLSEVSFTHWTPDQWALKREYRRRENAREERFRRWLTVRLGAKYVDIAHAMSGDARVLLEKTIPLACIGTSEKEVIAAFLRGEEPTQEVFEFECGSALVGCLHDAITAKMGFPIPCRIQFLDLWLTPEASSKRGSWPCGLFEWEQAPDFAIKAFKEKFSVHISMG